MRRALALVGTVAAMAALTLSPADAGETATYRYVARDFHTAYVGPDASTPAGRLAPQGILVFVPEGTSVTITVDDHVTKTGTIAISVTVSDGSYHRNLCVPAGTPTSVSGLKPGVSAWAQVWAPTMSGACDGGGTAGVATIAL